MSLYDQFILPKIVNTMCSMSPLTKQRKKTVPLATGRVLEIGMGSGLNLPFYDSSRVEFVWGLEPCDKMRKMAKKRARQVPFDVVFIEQGCENIPLEPDSADTILITYTLCTIPDAVNAIKEARKILKSDGKLIFCEHGRAPDKNILAWQNRMNPIWKQLGGGCNLNRPIPELIERGGFKISTLKSEYISNVKFVSYNYRGVAVKK